jgi:hypothetical protein
MSHFTLLVLLKEWQKVEYQLAPYSLDVKVEPYVIEERAKFIDETKKVFRRDFPDIANLPDDQFIDEMRKYGYTLDAEGNRLSTVNPKGFWDYWTVGGHYTGMLKLKTGEGVNFAKIKDIDFGINKEVYRKNIRFWELVVEGDKPKNVEEEAILKEYKTKTSEVGLLQAIFGTKENYARLESTFSTFAVLTPDGVWHDETELVDVHTWIQTYKERFIDTADPEWTAVIVDCHI